jgi:hypothetical protein
MKVDLRVALEALPAYLASIAWPANADTVARRVRELVPWGGHVQLNLWVDRSRATTLDVEVFAGNPEATPRDRIGFLQRLVGVGLASSEKAGVLAGTLGRSLKECRGFTVAKNWYVKLRFSGEALVDAKAYLALMPRPFLHHGESAERRPGAGVT